MDRHMGVRQWVGRAKEFTHHDTSGLIRRLLVRLSPGSLLAGNLEENIAGVIVIEGVVPA
jgi:hypothetical protein